MQLFTHLAQKQIQRAENTNQQRNFVTDKGSCKYKNSTVMDQIHERRVRPKTLEINNKICSEHEEKLEKVTEITYGDKKIVIKDTYEFNNNLSQFPTRDIYVASSEQPNKKTMFFRKTLVNEGGKDLLKRKTKNLVKNFCKSFIAYLNDKKQHMDSEFLEIKQQFLFEKAHYNNSLIKRIILDADFGPLFFDFLSNHASDWIKQSKIKDVQIHYQAIKVYLSLFEKKENSDHQSVYNEKTPPIEIQRSTFNLDNFSSSLGEKEEFWESASVDLISGSDMKPFQC